jgi:hypothetical protein
MVGRFVATSGEENMATSGDIRGRGWGETDGH